jgi:hypothetical protein
MLWAASGRRSLRRSAGLARWGQVYNNCRHARCSIPRVPRTHPLATSLWHAAIRCKCIHAARRRHGRIPQTSSSSAPRAASTGRLVGIAVVLERASRTSLPRSGFCLGSGRRRPTEADFTECVELWGASAGSRVARSYVSTRMRVHARGAQKLGAGARAALPTARVSAARSKGAISSRGTRPLRKAAGQTLW